MNTKINLNISSMIIWYIVLFVTFSFCGCNNAEETFSVGSEVSAAKGGKGILVMSAEVETSRSALPSATIEQFTRFELYEQSFKGSVDETTDQIGLWESYADMNNAQLSVTTGGKTFILVASCDTAIYIAQENVEIGSGINNIMFHLTLNSNGTGCGYGDVKITLSMQNVDRQKVNAVTVGLYSMNEDAITDYADESLTLNAADTVIYTKVTYNKTHIPSGDYIVIFRFYADVLKTQLLGTYREYACITANMLSTSQCKLKSLSSLYRIDYELNEGSFVGGWTAPGSYTRFSDDVILPHADKVTKASNEAGISYRFDGWYDNAEFAGRPVEKIASGSAGNKTFYAKWTKRTTVTFMSSNGESTVGSMEITVDESSCLMSAAALNMTNGKHCFLGWSQIDNTADIRFSDAEVIKVSQPQTFYAVWAQADINPIGANDNSDKDKDGVTDWRELHVYYTDPNCSDTDGDGIPDGDEISTKLNPLIADMPSIDVKFSGEPIISYLYTTTQSTSTSESKTENTGVTGSSSSTQTNAKTHNVTNGWSAKLGFKEQWKGTEFSFEASQEVGYSGSVTSGDTYTYSKSSSEGWSKSWANSKSSSLSSGKTITGGLIKIQAKFINPSNIAYTVKNLTIAINRIPTNSMEASIPVASIQFKGEPTIQPNSETGEYNLEVKLEGASAMENLLKWSCGLRMEVSGYTLESGGKDFTHAMTNVAAKTAAIYIDWGNTSGRPAQTYNISTKNLYDITALSSDDLYTKPDLQWIFANVLKYVANTDYTLSADGKLTSIYGIANQADTKNGAWFISHTHGQQGNRMVHVYPPNKDWALSDIKLDAGDEVAIIYNIDKDDDGVPFNEELIHGTSDDNPDTDGDGLTDFEELYGWYKSGIGLDAKYSELNTICTSPILIDTDGDDLLDYSTDADKQDNDPIIPKMKNIAEIESAKYAESARESFSRDIIFTNKSAVLPGNYTEYIFLDIVPKLSFSQVHYRMTETDPWLPLDKTMALPLKIGANTIYIQVTAPDSVTTNVYTLNLNSIFTPMNGGSLSTTTSHDGSGGKVSLTWSNYSDARICEPNSGYVLYIYKGLHDFYYTGKPSRTEVEVAANFINGNKYTDDVGYILKMTADDMARGSALIYVLPNTTYDFGLFAYVGSDDNNSYQVTTLYANHCVTARDKSGKLTLYLCQLRNDSSKDGGPACDPEYYWYFGSDIEWKDKNQNDLSTMNVGRRGAEMDEGNNQYYNFSTRNTQKNAVSKDQYVAFTATFERNQNYTKYLYMEIYEADTSKTYDDYIGKCQIGLSYDKTADKWDVTWGNNKKEVKCGAADMTEVSYGQRSTDGDVTPKFGIKWE